MTTSFAQLRRRFFSVLASFTLAAGSVAPACAQTTAAPASANPGPAITGFRSATFGMTEAQVRHAVTAAFKLPASAITPSLNVIQHTEILSVTVPDLIPGGGAAGISYVFGYQSHKLMEISVVWSSQNDPKMTPQLLYQNGESLQQYFAGEGFPAERSTGNIATPTGLLLFRATDPTGNAVLLILSGTMSKDAKSSDKSTLAPTALTLLYAADPQHPDVFQLNKGSF